MATNKLPDEVLELCRGELEQVGPRVKTGHDVHVVGEAESLEVQSNERLDSLHIERIGRDKALQARRRFDGSWTRSAKFALSADTLSRCGLTGFPVALSIVLTRPGVHAQPGPRPTPVAVRLLGRCSLMARDLGYDEIWLQNWLALQSARLG